MTGGTRLKDMGIPWAQSNSFFSSEPNPSAHRFMTDPYKGRYVYAYYLRVHSRGISRCYTMAYQLVTLKPVVAVGRGVPLNRPRAVKNDDLYRLESFFESGVVVQHDSVEAPPSGQLGEQQEGTRPSAVMDERDTTEETTSQGEVQGNNSALQEGVLKHLSQVQGFRQSSMKVAFSYLRTGSRAMGDAMKNIPMKLTLKTNNETVGKDGEPGVKKSVSVALREEVQNYRSKVQEYAAGVRQETLVTADRAQTAISQYRRLTYRASIVW